MQEGRKINADMEGDGYMSQLQKHQPEKVQMRERLKDVQGLSKIPCASEPFPTTVIVILANSVLYVLEL